ncbi:SRPBCC family protein [Phenylobacterium sp.]|jgi:hypothetical protein|uniref:SRPBCC family protein n=1 Tax=Phenylobacterium sp. TaxID=1871053 RepID=UPI002F9318D9
MSPILKTCLAAAALALCGSTALAQPAAAPAAPPAAKPTEYVTVPLEATLNVSAETAWKKIGGYCDIGSWMKTTCVITSGKDGEVGSVRRIANRVDEVLVARTPMSYTYAQPKSPIDYHGTVEVRADGKNKSKLLYTLVYDVANMASAEAKAADQARRKTQFTNVVNTMKGIAEAK